MTKHGRDHMKRIESKLPDRKILQQEAQARRDFLKQAVAVGVAAPAVTLLLSAKPAQAQNGYQLTIIDGPTSTTGVSDIRLKRDIALLSRLDNGLGLYCYRYLWSDLVYVGVMAQEVEKVMPEAVARGADGYLRVDYRRLGLRLMTLPEGTDSLTAVPAVAA